MIISRYIEVHPDSDKKLLDTLNQGITKLTENSIIDTLRTNYFVADGECDY
jgi:hypothetical protein